MVPSLGKRKRQTAEPVRREASVESSSGADEDAQDVFRKHFEKHFLPIDLPVQNGSKKSRKDHTIEEQESEDDESSDWEGISESDGAQAIEIVEHRSFDSGAGMSKAELKAFMSSKLPSNTTLSKATHAEPADEDDTTEAANLKNDLALQRLLAESHLLESADNTNPTGKNRHKALDLRVMSLGGKSSIMKQEKMPMSHRKGIIAKQVEREDTRRREARENGIILERPKPAKGKKSSGSGGRRDRGIGAPGVGKFSSATLKLSRNDIRDIEGPRRGGMMKGKGKGRGRRGAA